MAWLSPAQVRSFRDNGFLAISGFFTEAEVDAVDGAYDSVWEDLPPEVVVDSEATGRRVRIEDLTEAERRQSFKVNDLYLRNAGLRDVVMSTRLGAILHELLDEEPVVINTLSCEYGTQQADHLDTLFMTPLSPGRLVASWMALEDVTSDSGPLRYYPESNHIEPYRFEDGGYHVRPAEMEQWSDYMAGEVDRHGLAETRYLARRGDLFIWDAWLLHGGSEIASAGVTRRSLITHYFTRSDCETLRSDLRPAPGGAWMLRPPQTVPGESPEQTETMNQLAHRVACASEHAADTAHPRAAGPVPLPARPLRERLDTLDLDA
jgi:phytanoyl-CoA hydroxylase